MLKRLSFGQYKYKDSIVHELDPRLKLLYMLALSILVFTINDLTEILIFSLFAFMLILLSRLSANDLIKGLRPFILIFAFILLMYLLFSRNQLGQGLITIWRFLMLVIMSLALTYTTTISSLVAAIEKLAKPLKAFGAKPRNIAVAISIAIRFVPVMFINLERLREAMAARLADFRRLKSIKLIFIVLLERMLRSASSLSDALQSRMYNENAESYRALKLKKYDYLSFIFILIFSTFIY